ncbi:N-acetyltransferase [Arenicella sp. 4NH20-0111]|uniref:N-acetyltransferase n=1 Tax=Arenicella sp. 4NH20-0111 TaxID=3127648 RepID=UPI00310C01B1
MKVTQEKTVVVPIDDRVEVARECDVAGIQALLNHYAALGNLLPRTKKDIIRQLSHFRVIKQNNKVIACGSLENFTPDLAEIRSLMVDESIKGRGLGRKIVIELISMAKIRNVERLMALTYVPEFFHKLGFETVDKNIFPEKVWGICVNCYKFENCDEIAVLKKL